MATKTRRSAQGVPERTLVQRMAALQRANVVRGKRAELKRDLKAKRVKVHDLLLDPPDWLETMKIFDLIVSCPKYGKIKTNKVLQQCRISPAKTIGGMSVRQRTELVSMLR